MSYKQIISIGLDLTWGGGEFEYIPEDLENLTPQQLGFIQEMLLHFIYETERLKREKREDSPLKIHDGNILKGAKNE